MSGNGRRALLLIDPQLGFLTGNGPVFRLAEFLAAASSLLDGAHRYGVQVVFLRFDGPVGHLAAPGQPGWHFHPELRPAPGDLVLPKPATDSFLGTRLDDTLHGLGIEELYVTGCLTELCVDTTCRRALSLGYRTVLVTDGHVTPDLTIAGVPPAKRIELANFVLPRVGSGQRYIETLPSEQALRRWSR